MTRMFQKIITYEIIKGAKDAENMFLIKYVNYGQINKS